MAIYILTSTETILEAIARPQESHVGDSAAKGLLNLQLKQQLTSSSFDEQQGYLSTSATAAYVSLNKLDQRHRYRASINLNPINSDSFNFVQGSSSSGLGYALALFQTWWEAVLHNTDSFQFPVFATGEILPSGQVNAIGHLNKKIDSLCTYVESNKSSIDRFYLCYPSNNNNEITPEERTRIEELGGVLYPVARLQDLLGDLLGNAYNGDPLGRWQPFKGLKSFNYEDSVRFFGRVKDTDRLYDDLQQNNGLLIVSGPSGAGKSSLIKAGLIPKLEKYNQNLHWAYTTPSDISKSGVLNFVLKQFIIAWSLTSKGIALADLETAFKESIDSGVALLAIHLTSQSPRCLLYFDQYEEVFSQADQSIEDITQNLKLIDELSRKIENLNIVLALRNEYLGRLLDNQAFRSPIISNVTSQLSSNSWYDIVHEQAAFSGIEFEKDNKEQTLDSIIIEEALQTPFALPMVEFLLEQLHLNANLKSNGQKILSFSDYETLGGLSGAIAYRASEILSKSNFSDQANKLFSIFIGLNSDYLPFGKQVVLSEVEENDPDLYGLIQDFINANIIVSYRNSANEPIAKLAHDSLFEYWDTLKDWIATYNDYLTWRYSIDGQFTQWINHKNQSGSGKYLITDKRLLKEGWIYKKRQSINEKNIIEYVSLSFRRSRKILASYLSVFLLLPLLITSLYIFDDSRIKTYYYSSIGEKWSVPFGIDELSADQVKHRVFSYRLDYQGGDLIKLTHQNGFGTPTIDPSRENESSWEYKYTESNQILSSTSKGGNGSILKVTDYQFNDDSAIASFNDKFGKVKLNRIGKNIESMPFSEGASKTLLSTISDISRHYLIYDEFGFLKKIVFQNPYGVNVPKINNGNYGIGYTYYKNGKISSKYSINSLGMKYKNISSPVIEYIYNETGDLEIEKTIYPDKSLNTVYKSDDWGNLTDILHSEGNRSFYAGDKIPRVTMEIDMYGNVQKISSYNEKDNLNGVAYGIAVFDRSYDNKGRVLGESYFGSDFKPIKYNNLYAKFIHSLDSRGNILSQSWYGLDGEVILDNFGCEKTTFVFDLNNNPIEQSCFKIEGDYMMDNDGISKYLVTYSNLGDITDLKNYGLDGLPVNNTDGFSSVSFKYDDNGNKINERYYDTNGLSTSLKGTGNVTSFDFKYDFKGNIIEEAYKNSNGENSSIDGIHKTTYSYDPLGRVTEYAYFGINDNPIMHSEMGYSKKVTVYAQGKDFIKSQNYYNDKGELTFPFLYQSDIYIEYLKNLKSNIDYSSPYTLEISSKPSNALVFVDDIYVGNTPLSKEFRSSHHKLKVIKSGYISDESTVNLDTTGNSSIKIVLLNESKPNFSDILTKAEAGESEAQKIVGNHYLNGGNVEQDLSKAFDWYKKSALQSNPKAIYNIGYLYATGSGVEKNLTTALSWYERAANLGFARAQHIAGMYFIKGWAGERDFDKSYEYFTLAAKQDYIPSIFQLASMNLYGFYLTKNIERALELFRENANRGDPDSAYQIAVMYYSGIDIEKSDSKSSHWFHLAAQLGFEDAFLFTGNAYLNGLGIKQDSKKAMSWYNKSSKSKSEFAKHAYGQLALMHENAIGIPNNYIKAIEYHEKALLAGNNNSAMALGILFIQGKGASVDINKAVKLFRLAEENGDVRGKEWLERLGR